MIKTIPEAVNELCDILDGMPKNEVCIVLGHILYIASMDGDGESLGAVLIETSRAAFEIASLNDTAGMARA